MPYDYNPHKHVKIWLSKDKNTFLNVENQLRLVRMRESNPQDEINFVYDSNLLSESAQQALAAFCNKHKIQPKDVRHELFNACTTQEERGLLALYEDEVTHLDEGGNLGAASDLIRWIKPVYELGTYTDFDIEVNTRSLPATITVEQPLLQNIGSIHLNPEVEALYMNNNMIAVVDPSSSKAQNRIKIIQHNMLNACKSSKSFFVTQMEDSSAQQDPGNQALSQFLNSLPATAQPTALGLRKLIKENTENNVSFSRYVFKSHGLQIPEVEDDVLQRQAATLLREDLKYAISMRHMNPAANYNSLEKLAAIERDDELLTIMRENTNYQLLKMSIMHTTGPGILYAAVGSYFLSTEEVELFANCSFTHYRLNRAFIDKCYYPLHTTQEQAMRLASSPLGEDSDVSWSKKGLEMIQAREKNMERATIKIQRFFRTHIEKKGESKHEYSEEENANMSLKESVKLLRDQLDKLKDSIKESQMKVIQFAARCLDIVDTMRSSEDGIQQVQLSELSQAKEQLEYRIKNIKGRIPSEFSELLSEIIGLTNSILSENQQKMAPP